MAHTAHVTDQWSSYILSLDKGAMSGTKAPTLNAMHKVKFPIKKDIQRAHRLYANIEADTGQAFLGYIYYIQNIMLLRCSLR